MAFDFAEPIEPVGPVGKNIAWSMLTEELAFAAVPGVVCTQPIGSISASDYLANPPSLARSPIAWSSRWAGWQFLPDGPIAASRLEPIDCRVASHSCKTLAGHSLL